MGNRAGKGRNRNQLIKCINLGKKGDQVVTIIGHCKALGILNDDKFSEWIRKCIINEYSKHEGVKASIITAQLKTIRSQMSELARERDYFEAQLDNLGYEYDYEQNQLVRKD